MSNFNIGDVVRSYDFQRGGNSYIEGVITKIAPVEFCAEGCNHYHIKVHKTCRGGVTLPAAGPHTHAFVYPAVAYNIMEKIDG